MPPYTIDSPAKKQSKWSAEEDALIIELRGSGMKWEDISKRLPGRSAISCRLHYQNYLERRSEWDEERKNKLARLYERFKPDMWAKVAEEMQVPWRAAEAMHWQLGEADMARRAGVTPFSLTATTIEASSSSGHHRRSPSHLSYQQQPQGYGHHHSQGGFRPDTSSAGGSSSDALFPRGSNPSMPLPPPPPMYGDRLVTGLGVSGSSSSGRGFVSSSGRRERGSTPGHGGSSFGGGPSDPANAMYHYHQQHHSQQHQHAGPGLPPIQTGGGPPILQQQERPGGGSSALPSFAEITTGVSPYSTPAYSLGTSPAPSNTDSPGPGSGHGGFAAYSTGGHGAGPGPEPPTSAGAAGKRRASPNFEPRDHRRRYLQSPRYDDGRGGASSGSGFHRG